MPYSHNHNQLYIKNIHIKDKNEFDLIYKTLACFDEIKWTILPIPSNNNNKNLKTFEYVFTNFPISISILHEQNLFELNLFFFLVGYTFA